jgi:hypothetical protein
MVLLIPQQGEYYMAKRRAAKKSARKTKTKRATARKTKTRRRRKAAAK